MNYWQTKINAAKAKAAAAKRRKTRLAVILGGLLATAGAAGGVVHMKRTGNARAASATGLRVLNASRAAAKTNFVANLTKSYPRPVLVRNANNGRVNFRNVYNANGAKYIKRGNKVFTLKKEPHSGTLVGGLTVYTINSQVQF